MEKKLGCYWISMCIFVGIIVSFTRKYAVCGNSWRWYRDACRRWSVINVDVTFIIIVDVTCGRWSVVNVDVTCGRWSVVNVDVTSVINVDVTFIIIVDVTCRRWSVGNVDVTCGRWSVVNVDVTSVINVDVTFIINVDVTCRRWSVGNVDVDILLLRRKCFCSVYIRKYILFASGNTYCVFIFRWLYYILGVFLL